MGLPLRSSMDDDGSSLLLDAQFSVSDSHVGDSAVQGLGSLRTVSVQSCLSDIDETSSVDGAGSRGLDTAVGLFSLLVAGTVDEGTSPRNAPDLG